MDERGILPKERLFPTRRKGRIGSYLSWPVGAKVVSEAFAAVPQAKEFEVEFAEPWPKYHQGRWPVRIPVLEVEYRRYRNPHLSGFWAEPDWTLIVRPVPRELKPKVRSALETIGFKRAGEWLTQNERLHGREGSVRFCVLWNSESDGLEFETKGNAVPEVTTDVAIRRYKQRGEESE